MRTTVDLKEEHRALLHAIAAQRGWRGFSRVIEEAIDFYLKRNAMAMEARRSLLARRGAWSDEEAAKIRTAIKELRQRWTVESS